MSSSAASPAPLPGDSAEGVRTGATRRSSDGESVAFADVSPVGTSSLLAAIAPPEVQQEIAAGLARLPATLRDEILTRHLDHELLTASPLDELAMNLRTVLAARLGLSLEALLPPGIGADSPDARFRELATLGGLHQSRLLVAIFSDSRAMASPEAARQEIERRLPAAWEQYGRDCLAQVLQSTPEAARHDLELRLDRLEPELRLTVLTANGQMGGLFGDTALARLGDNLGDAFEKGLPERTLPTELASTWRSLPYLERAQVMLDVLNDATATTPEAKLALFSRRLAEAVRQSPAYQQLPPALRTALDALAPEVRLRVLTREVDTRDGADLATRLRFNLETEVRQLSAQLPAGMRRSTLRAMRLDDPAPPGSQPSRAGNATDLAAFLAGLAVPAPGSPVTALGRRDPARLAITARLDANAALRRQLFTTAAALGTDTQAMVEDLLGRGLVSMAELQAILGPGGGVQGEADAALAQRVTLGIGLLVAMRLGLPLDAFQPPLVQVRDASGQPDPAGQARLNERLRAGEPLATLIDEILPLADPTRFAASDTVPPPRLDAPAGTDGLWRPKHLMAIASFALDAQQSGHGEELHGMQFRIETVPPENTALDPLSDFIGRARPAYFTHATPPPTMHLVDGAETLAPPPRLRAAVRDWQDDVAAGRLQADPATPAGRLAMTMQTLLQAQVIAGIQAAQEPVQNGLYLHLQEASRSEGPQALLAHQILTSGLRPDQMASLWAIELLLVRATSSGSSGQAAIQQLRNYLGSLDADTGEAQRIQTMFGERIVALNATLAERHAEDPRSAHFRTRPGQPIPSLAAGQASAAPADGLIVIGGGRPSQRASLRPNENVSQLLLRTNGEVGTMSLTALLTLNRHDPGVQVRLTPSQAGQLGLSQRTVSADAYLRAISDYRQAHGGQLPAALGPLRTTILVRDGHPLLLPSRTDGYGQDVAQQRQIDQIDSRTQLLWGAGQTVAADLQGMTRSRSLDPEQRRWAAAAVAGLQGPMPQPPMPMDGTYGRRTREAIERLQQQSGGGRRDGMFGMVTLDNWVARLRAGIGPASRPDPAISRYVNHEGGHALMEHAFEAFGNDNLQGVAGLDRREARSEQLMYLWSHLSGWRLDGNRLPGMESPDPFSEDTAAAVASMSGQSHAGNRYSHDPDAGFVSDYARTSAEEDFAESLRFFRQNPGTLLRRSPEKFLFMNAMMQRYSTEEVMALATQVYGSEEIAERRLGEAIHRLETPPSHAQYVPSVSRHFVESPTIVSLRHELGLEVPATAVASPPSGSAPAPGLTLFGIGDVVRDVAVAASVALVATATGSGGDRAVLSGLLNNPALAVRFAERAVALPMPATGNANDPRNADLLTAVKEALVATFGEESRVIVNAMSSEALLELRVSAADVAALALLRPEVHASTYDNVALVSQLRQTGAPAALPAALGEQLSPGMRAFLSGTDLQVGLLVTSSDRPSSLVGVLQDRPWEILHDVARTDAQGRTERDARVAAFGRQLNRLTSGSLMVGLFTVSEHAQRIRADIIADPALRTRYQQLLTQAEDSLQRGTRSDASLRMTKIQELRGLLGLPREEPPAS